MRISYLVAIFATGVVIAACAQLSAVPAGTECETTQFSVEDNFSGARRGRCTVLAADHVELRIRPEDEGRINNSPWYAFRLRPNHAGTANVTLRYEGGNHRYWPKTSRDGMTWTRLDTSAVRADTDGEHAHFAIELGDEPVYVAAQELITPKVYDVWRARIAARDIPVRVIGESKRGLPIHAFDSNPESKSLLLLMGRQHPPEVSGAIAMQSFVDTVFSTTDLATRFRERFRVVAVPLLNPDGVVGGNWRHNLGSTDLNRDWGMFRQPETRAVATLLDEYEASDGKLRMVVDFHSTSRNVFYAHYDVTDPPNFTERWLNQSRPRITDYEFGVSRSPIQNAAVAKNYFYERYGIPAITYEVGDETDRAAARAAAIVFAEELMRLMLEQDY
ncbi:MAG: M14-type cytosolic carboxypeptidase [Pseudomonadota bacterium]